MAKARGLQQQKRCESELTSLSLERGYVIQEYIGTLECFSSSEHCGWRLNSPARQGQCCHHKTLYNIGDEDLTAEMRAYGIHTVERRPTWYMSLTKPDNH